MKVILSTSQLLSVSNHYCQRHNYSIKVIIIVNIAITQWRTARTELSPSQLLTERNYTDESLTSQLPSKRNYAYWVASVTITQWKEQYTRSCQHCDHLSAAWLRICMATKYSVFLVLFKSYYMNSGSDFDLRFDNCASCDLRAVLGVTTKNLLIFGLRCWSRYIVIEMKRKAKSCVVDVYSP